jgi:hypothetical protein
MERAQEEYTVKVSLVIFGVLTVVLVKSQVFWDIPSLVPIMSQINPVHSFPSCFFMIHFV